MLRIARCPGCGGEPVRHWPALVAPFIAARALRRPVETCALLQCGSCDLRFFDLRFEQAEIERLYRGYREEGYFRERHRYEPWYTRALNESRGGDPEGRKECVLRALAPHAELASVLSVLDYGGDAGQMIPDALGREKAVYELSDVAPVPGVRRISLEEELADGYDVVLASHVLEHHSEPSLLARKLRALTRDGGLLYLEVPWERTWLGLVGTGPLTEAYLRALARGGLALRAIDFVSTAARTFLGAVPPFGFLKLHEHLNFFDVRSLAALAASAGFEVLSCERTSWLPGGRREVVVCVARATAPRAAG